MVAGPGDGVEKARQHAPVADKPYMVGIGGRGRQRRKLLSAVFCTLCIIIYVSHNSFISILAGSDRREENDVKIRLLVLTGVMVLAGLFAGSAIAQDADIMSL